MLQRNTPTRSKAAAGVDLGLRTLGSLLADGVSCSSALAGQSGVLGLVSLLGGGGSGLLVLALLDGGGAGGAAGLGALRAALLNHIERSTDDATLSLDGTARALLGNFL